MEHDFPRFSLKVDGEEADNYFQLSLSVGHVTLNVWEVVSCWNLGTTLRVVCLGSTKIQCGVHTRNVGICILTRRVPRGGSFVGLVLDRLFHKIKCACKMSRTSADGFCVLSASVVDSTTRGITKTEEGKEQRDAHRS